MTLYKQFLTCIALVLIQHQIFGLDSGGLWQKKESYQADSLWYTINAFENKTYGYDIIKNGKLYIRQSVIPVVAGTSGFISKEEAIKVAELVISKIKYHQLPPNVTKEELIKLNITLP